MTKAIAIDRTGPQAESPAMRIVVLHDALVDGERVRTDVIRRRFSRT
nr:hypothetical protein [uncultured Brevundimonas sp.]